MDQNIFRVCKNKENPYVMINKGFLNDKNLSLKAKGLLSYLLSLPDDWKIYEQDLVTRHKDGRDSLRSGVNELIQSGYITMEKIRNEKGQFIEYKYTVYERPNNTHFFHAIESTIGKPNNGFSNSGKPTTTNNNQTNKKINKPPIAPQQKPPSKKIIELPDWLPKDDWDAFLAFRKEVKSEMGPVGISRAINRLSEFRDDGEDISAVLNQSIVNGWKGLFRVQAENRNYGKQKQIRGEGGLVF